MADDREWDADIAVITLGAGPHLMNLRQHGGQGIFGAGLTHTAGNTDDFGLILKQNKARLQPQQSDNDFFNKLFEFGHSDN